MSGAIVVFGAVGSVMPSICGVKPASAKLSAIGETGKLLPSSSSGAATTSMLSSSREESGRSCPTCASFGASPIRVSEACVAASFLAGKGGGIFFPCESLRGGNAGGPATGFRFRPPMPRLRLLVLHKLFCPGGPGSGTPGGGSGCPLPIGSPLALSGEDCICWPGNEAVDAVECKEAAADEFLVDLGKLKEAVDEEDDTFVDCRLRTCKPHFFAAFAAVLRWEAVGGGTDWLADLVEDDMEGDLVVGTGMLGDRGVGKPGSSISLPGVVGSESRRKLSDM